VFFLSELDLIYEADFVRFRFQVEISQVKLRITACADSIITLGALAGDLSKLAPSS